MADNALETAIDKIIENLGIQPTEMLFVGTDGQPESLKFEFKDMSELRRFFTVALLIGSEIGRQGNDHEL